MLIYSFLYEVHLTWNEVDNPIKVVKSTILQLEEEKEKEDDLSVLFLCSFSD